MIDISISNLSKEFEVGKKILDGLTFQVDQGERVGLLGKNGAGKTTLFKVLTGELDWDEGEVHVAPGKGGPHLTDPGLPARLHRGGCASDGL
ncbi:MAG: ATP-binding cassette domain-containing protein [Flavonifractor plautii]